MFDDLRIWQPAGDSRYRQTMRNDMEQIGLTIRTLREARGVSQAELASALDIDETAVSKIEHGRRGLAAAELALLSEYLRTTADAVLFPEGGEFAGTLLRGDAGPDAERVKEQVEGAFADLRYLRALVDS